LRSSTAASAPACATNLAFAGHWPRFATNAVGRPAPVRAAGAAASLRCESGCSASTVPTTAVAAAIVNAAGGRVRKVIRAPVLRARGRFGFLRISGQYDVTVWRGKSLEIRTLRAKGGEMPSKKANVKNEKQYEALKKKGMSKERAAKIANSPGASSRGGKKSGSKSK
jgi:hypothetical protein